MNMNVTKRHIKKAIKELGFNEEDFNIVMTDFHCKKVHDYETSMYNHFTEMVLEHIDKVQGYTVKCVSIKTGFDRWDYDLTRGEFSESEKLARENMD